VVDARTGIRNEFLRGIGRKLDLTVTGFSAFRTDPKLKQIRIELADRAEKTTITGAKGIAFSCPDGQLQMVLRGAVGAIDQLPELTPSHSTSQNARRTTPRLSAKPIASPTCVMPSRAKASYRGP
jgi:hypothetical protein